MEREQATLERLVHFLLSHGYPSSSIIPDYAVGKFRVDLAIVDPVTGKIVALFEFKRKREAESLSMASQQLKAYAAAVADPNVGLYAVVSSPQDPGVAILRYDADAQGFEDVPVPEYSLLVNRFIHEALAKTKKAVDRTSVAFAGVAWVLALLTFSLFALRISGRIVLKAEDIALFGVGVGLVILPFASKLKLLGFEFERYKKEAEK